MNLSNANDSGATPWAKPGRNLMILTLLLAFPSTGFVQKYAGLAGVAAYVVLVAACLVLTAKFGARFAPVVERHFRVLAGVFLAGCAFLFSILYPIENAKGFGKSSDRDDGLNRAASRMVEGITPYYQSDQHAGPLSVLPGSVILATPFVELGNSAYQNLFWIAAFLFAACRTFKNNTLALCLAAVPFAISPAALYEFISGGDVFANGIFVALFFLIALASWPAAPGASKWHGWAACVLLGIGLASRPNFLLLLPLFGSVLWQKVGLRKAVAATGLVALVAAAITLPFYLNDPAGFTPLLAKQKLAIVDHALPWASNAIIGMTATVGFLGAIVLLRHPETGLNRAFFRWCALVTLCPMVCAVVLFSVINGHLDFGFMSDRFGMMYVFFALLGWGDQMLGGGPALELSQQPVKGGALSMRAHAKGAGEV